MSKYCGYMGKVLLVDLSSQSVSEYPWSDRYRELYIGGKMMAARILYDNFTGNEAPFSEENLIVISTGPLTGTGAPASNRFNISSLSPQTGIIASSNCGGNFGYYLKKAGLDALIIKGKCSEHTWLELRNEKIVFHNADDLWGLWTTPSQEKLQEKLDAERGCRVKAGMITIGPAGENLVKYSAVISGERASGRAGMGAVFGWKNVKAVVATGNHEVTIFQREKARQYNRDWIEQLRAHPLTGNQLPRLGTAGLVSSMQMRGILASKNYEFGQYDDFEKVSGELLAENFNVVNKGCLSCPMKCARTIALDGKDVKGPELETLGLLGGGILNDDLALILKWNNLLDELGMDTISCSSTIAWAMEANEKGLWENGLKFGETEHISQLFEDIAYRRGIGNELAEGSRILSIKYGGNEFAMQSKGLEMAAYEPRRAVGQGLGYAVANRGACHLNGGYLVIIEGLGLYTDSQTPKAKADLTMVFQDLMETISASGQCLFTSYAIFPAILFTKPNGFITRFANYIIPHVGWAVRIVNKFPEMLCFNINSLVRLPKCLYYNTGLKMNLGSFFRTGERGYTLERAIDVKFGISSKDDTLPKKMTNVPQDPNDPRTVVPLEIMKKSYYKARGWSKDGKPTEKILRRLKIEG